MDRYDAIDRANVVLKTLPDVAAATALSIAQVVKTLVD